MERLTDTEAEPRTSIEAAPLREERKVVTALFADLVGSTMLAERLDADEVRLIVGEAIARIVGIVETFGGTVKDLAGDGVLALFGAPISHEDDAERAVRASLRLANEIPAYGVEVARAWGIEGLSVRVGVATGPVVLGSLGAGRRVEYAAFGDTVNTAARLQATAEPGNVLVSESTRRGIESLFDWGEWQQLSLKGKSEPVTACRALTPRTAGGRMREEGPVHAHMVGRDRELMAAQQIGDRVLEGSGAILFLTGEAGIGKSRLVAELRSHLDHAPAARGRSMWLEGRCVSYGESMPYLPFRDLLREWLGVAADEAEMRVRVALRRRVERLFAQRAPEVYPYLGAVLSLALERDAAARLAELSPEALQYRTFEVVREWLSRLAEDGPVVVALEDLHWADGTSLQLVERLMSLTEEAAVLMLITGRPERDHASWSMKQSAMRDLPHRTTEIVLEALSGDADHELLEALIGEATLPADLEDRMIEHAEGNPFYLEELIRSLVDGGALVRDNGAWRFDHAVNVEVPATVEKVILARIDRLSTTCHDVLLSAAVLGRQFGLSWLEGVAGPAEDLHGTLQELQRLDLLREGRRWPQPEFRFKHVLIQEAAYRTILVGEAHTSAPSRSGMARASLQRQHRRSLRAAGSPLARVRGRGQGDLLSRPRR
jgi:class 3 adenylate cyclase